MFKNAFSFSRNLCWSISTTSTTANMFTSSVGSVRSDCFKCLAGEYRVDEETCDLCPIGTYANQPTSGSTGALTCTACPNSSHISIKGSDSENDCRAACSSGLLLAPTENQSAFCTSSCPSWSTADSNGMTCSNIFCEAGSFSIGEVCRLCPVGFHQPALNQKVSCDACPGGRYSSEEGAVSCIKCKNATYSLSSSTECLSVSYKKPLSEVCKLLFLC